MVLSGALAFIGLLALLVAASGIGSDAQQEYRVSCTSLDKVGPKQWLKKVSPGELKEIVDACMASYPYSAKTSRRRRRDVTETVAANVEAIPEERIVNGKLATLNQFPHTVGLTYRVLDAEGRKTDIRLAAFMANIISRWHLLGTALAVKNPFDYLLAYGGVCLGNALPDGKANCPNGRDGLSATIDFALKAYGVTSRTTRIAVGPGQLALLQLGEDLGSFRNSKNRDRVNFGCLPPRDASVPDEVLVNGYGMLLTPDQSQTNEIYAEHLRYQNFLTKPKKEWGLTETENCKSRYNFCAYPPDASNNTADFGDTGGSATTAADASKKKPDPLLLGMFISNEFTPDIVITPGGAPINFDYDVHTRVSNYVQEICFYIGLCFPGVTGMTTYTRLGSIYISRPRSDFPSLQPFNMLSDAENRTLDTKPDLDALGYIGNGGVPQCLLAPITPVHAITSRRCLFQLLKQMPKPTTVQIYYANPKSDYSLDFFAWQQASYARTKSDIAFHSSYFNDLVIVQCKKKK